MPRPQKKNNKRILIQKCYVKLTRCDEMKNKQNTEMKKQTHPTITEKIMAKKRGRPPVLKSKLKTTTTKTPPQRTRPAPSPSPSPSPSPPPKADRRRTRLNVSTGVSLSTNTESAPPRKPRKKSIEKPLILTSKRTPKPNRRYMNDDENVVTKVNTHKNRDNEDTSNFDDEDDNDANDDDGDYDQQIDHNENTKKDKNKNIIINKKKNTDDDYKIDDDEDDDDDDDAAAADDDDDNKNNNDDDDDRHSENIALVKSLRVPKKIVNYTGKPPKSNASAIKSNASLQIALKNALANVSKKRKLNVQEEKQQQRRRSSEVDKVKRLKLNHESTISENSLNNKSTNVLAKTGGIVTSTPLMTTKRFAPSQLNEHKKPAILGKRSSMPSPITKLPSSSAGTIKQPSPPPSPSPSPSPSPPPPLPTKPSSSSKSVITRAAVLTLTTNTAAPNFKREVPVKTSAQFLNTLNKSTTIRNVQGKQAMTITKVTSKNDDDSKISLKPVNNTITRTTTTLNLKDFEQMPTFTIVNINDIINQKEDAVIQESVAHKKNLPPPRIQAVDNKKTVIAKKINNIILNNKEVLNNAAKYNNNNNNKIIELMDDTSDDDTLSTLDSVTLFGSSSKKPNKKEAQALKNKNNIPSKMGMANGQLKTTPPNRYVPLKPQRILNSTLCNNPTPLTKLVSKVISNSNNNNTNNNNNKIINNNISNDNTKIVPVKQHLPLTNRTENNQQNKNSTNNSEYKFISSDRPRLLRKVTCYETWFILHVEDDKPQKPPTFICEMSLIRLGNRIKELNLPTSKWSYKIALQRKPFMLKSNKNNVIKIKDDDDDDDDDDDSEDDDDEDGSNGREEIYRGEVQDSALNSKTPEIYQPINIMFRREVQPNNYLNKGIVANQTTQLKFQYDRAVIFRNQTFFLNIDGKSIRLIGAPLCIKTLQDVQILLEIVNDINLNNPFVEYTNSLI